MSIEKRYFDLNIEQVLENWEVYHAVREIIANALDETVLTNASSVDIFKDGEGLWHIRDFGRGLHYHHFSQNENEEKSNAQGIIGKFGVGLKDALAVFYRNNIRLKIKSRHGFFSTEMHKKGGFGDMETLHISVSETDEHDFVGTEFILSISDDDMLKAKKLFLVFSYDNPIETTEFGEIFSRNGSVAIIYVNGIQVAEEENYMFNYNITRLSTAMKKALNRERSNVGRTAYADTVKKLLLKSNSETVIQQLVNELKNLSVGGGFDEINYIDIQTHAMKTYNAQKPVVFISQMEAYELSNDDKEKIIESGREMVIVPQNAFDKIKDSTDINGNIMGTFDLVRKEYNDNFEYVWVSPNELSSKQRIVWEKHYIVMDWLEDKTWRHRIKISKTINEYTNGDTNGVYDSIENAIIIKQSVLDKENVFFDVLIHEYIHAVSGYPDNNRNFENELGKIIGKMGIEIFSNQVKKDKTREKETSLSGKLFDFLNIKK
jgi:hypothetical protein